MSSEVERKPEICARVCFIKPWLGWPASREVAPILLRNLHGHWLQPAAKNLYNPRRKLSKLALLSRSSDKNGLEVSTPRALNSRKHARLQHVVASDDDRTSLVPSFGTGLRVNSAVLP